MVIIGITGTPNTIFVNIIANKGTRILSITTVCLHDRNCTKDVNRYINDQTDDFVYIFLVSISTKEYIVRVDEFAT